MNAYDLPNKEGHFGPYGGIFVALHFSIEDLRKQYEFTAAILISWLNSPMN